MQTIISLHKNMPEKNIVKQWMLYQNGNLTEILEVLEIVRNS